MSRKCYAVAFKLRAVVTAEGKRKSPLLKSLKWTYKYEESVRVVFSKEKLIMLKKSGKYYSPSLFIDTMTLIILQNM